MTTARWIVVGFGVLVVCLGDLALRGIALVAALFGAFFVWSAAPRRSQA